MMYLKRDEIGDFGWRNKSFSIALTNYVIEEKDSELYTLPSLSKWENLCCDS